MAGTATRELSKATFQLRARTRTHGMHLRPFRVLKIRIEVVRVSFRPLFRFHLKALTTAQLPKIRASGRSLLGAHAPARENEQWGRITRSHQRFSFLPRLRRTVHLKGSWAGAYVTLARAPLRTREFGAVLYSFPDGVRRCRLCVYACVSYEHRRPSITPPCSEKILLTCVEGESRIRTIGTGTFYIRVHAAATLFYRPYFILIYLNPTLVHLNPP